MARKKTTIGAISGHFPTAAERALDRSLAEQSVGAQQERMVEAAEVAAATVATTYRGVCPACQSHLYGTAPCPRCAMYAQRPSEWYLDADGEWCAV